MNTIIQERKELTNLEKFKLSLNNKLEKHRSYRSNTILDYKFSSTKNQFECSRNDEQLSEMNWFTIISVVERFFYTKTTVGWTKEHYISNVILFEDETISFYKDWEKQRVFEQSDFTYKELIELSKTNKSLNKKILIIWMYKWKLTKIETSYTSEIALQDFLDNEENNKTANIKWVERSTKLRNWDMVNYNVLSFKTSEDQLTFSDEEETNNFDKIANNIEYINSWLSTKVQEITKEDLVKVEDNQWLKWEDIPDFDYSND